MNIEEAVISYLQTALDTDAVYAEVPESTDYDEYFVVEKTSSTPTETSDLVRISTVAIQSYGASRLAAADLNEDLKEAMEGITALNQIGGCHLVTDYNFTNTAKKQHRYQAVYEITHH